MTFYLLSAPNVLSKLRSELKVALPDTTTHPSIKEMEQLACLSAVILEGLRLSMGTSNRQTRMNPDSEMAFHDGKKEWRIPRNVELPDFPPCEIIDTHAKAHRHRSAWPPLLSISTATISPTP